MTKTQNKKSYSQQSNTTTTNSTSSAPVTQKAGGTGTPSSQIKKNYHRRWQGKKKFGTAKNKITPTSTTPSKQYVSVCCKAPAVKPRCGTKVTVQDPETRRSKDKPLGLGHFRCSECRKSCKVTVQKPVPVTATPYTTTFRLQDAVITGTVTVNVDTVKATLDVAA